jgi:hypothetical protein
MTLRRGQIIIVLFSFWILAVILPNLHFAPGNWDTLRLRLTEKPPSLESFLGIVLIMAAILFAGLVKILWRGRWRKKKGEDMYQMYREPVRMPASVPAIFFLLLAAIAGMIWWAHQPSKGGGAVPPLHLGASPEKQRVETPPKTSPKALSRPRLPETEWVEYLLGMGLLVVGSWMIWRWLKERPGGEDMQIPEMQIPNVGQVAAQAALELERGADLSDVVLRCYRDMCNILRRKVALREEMTAREFAHHLQEAGVRGEEVDRLTALFEKVRYGRDAASPEERAEAIALLQEVENQHGNVTDET